MIVAANADNAVSDLDKYIVELERRLKNMVVGFAYEITLHASTSTPIGNAEDLNEQNPDLGQAKYQYLYKTRYDSYAIDPVVGFHRNAWVFSLNPSNGFNSVIGSNPEENVRSDATASYRLGDDFYISATGPGYKYLEQNTSEQTNGKGIVEPTIELIQSTYTVDLKRYFDGAI